MEYSIELVHNPIAISDLIPSYRYQFQNVDVPAEATAIYEDLLGFMKNNEELLDADNPSKDEYVRGFKKALAITRLWMDSLYVGQQQQNLQTDAPKQESD